MKLQRKLTTKKKNAQKATEHAEKKLHKKARTEEITCRLTNQAGDVVVNISFNSRQSHLATFP